MTDPDGLTEKQRVLVNDAHQAIAVSSGLAAIARTARPEGDDEADEGCDTSEARRRSRAALKAADAAGVPRAVLERTVRSAMAMGREQAGR